MITLTGITPWIHHYYWSNPFFIFQQKLNERLKGEVQLHYLGANEVVPIFSQFNAVQTGQIDVALGISSYYNHIVPEGMAVLYGHYAPKQLRNNGFYTLIKDIHLKKANVIYLANTGGVPSTAFRIFLNKKIACCADFRQLKIRALPVYTALLNKLGAQTVKLEPSQVATALKSEQIDGYGWSYGGISNYGWENMTKYVLDHPFYTANTCLLFNETRWKSLPTAIQIEIEKIGKELEFDSEVSMQQVNRNEDYLLQGLGIEKIVFSQQQRDLFLNTAYQAGWDELSEKCSEETLSQLKNCLGFNT